MLMNKNGDDGKWNERESVVDSWPDLVWGRCHAGWATRLPTGWLFKAIISDHKEVNIDEGDRFICIILMNSFWFYD